MSFLKGEIVDLVINCGAQHMGAVKRSIYVSDAVFRYPVALLVLYLWFEKLDNCKFLNLSHV